MFIVWSVSLSFSISKVDVAPGVLGHPEKKKPLEMWMRY